MSCFCWQYDNLIVEVDLEGDDLESEDEKEEVDDEAKDEDSKKYDPEVCTIVHWIYIIDR